MPDAVEHPLHIMTFRIGGQLYGLEADAVKEVLHGQPVYPMPLAPRDVRGVINLRGRVVTALDLNERLGKSCGSEGVIDGVVVESAGEPICLVVGQIDEIVVVPALQRTDSLAPWQRRFLRGLCRMEDEILHVLEVEAITAPSETGRDAPIVNSVGEERG